MQNNRKPTQKKMEKFVQKSKKKKLSIISPNWTELSSKKSCIKKLNCKQDNKSFKFIHINVSAIVKCFDLLDGQFRYEKKAQSDNWNNFFSSFYPMCQSGGEIHSMPQKQIDEMKKRREKKIIRAFHVRQINSTTKRRKNRNCTNTISMLSVSSLFSGWNLHKSNTGTSNTQIEKKIKQEK